MTDPDQTRETIRHADDAPEAPKLSDWVPVPREPTMDMLAAAEMALANDVLPSTRYTMPENGMALVYAQVLAAAPLPPVSDELSQWRHQETETQESLQAIGDEFGVRGGEVRTFGIRRVLTTQRARIEELTAEKERLISLLKLDRAQPTDAHQLQSGENGLHQTGGSVVAERDARIATLEQQLAEAREALRRVAEHGSVMARLEPDAHDAVRRVLSQGQSDE